jgi:hypothetical protein
MAMVVLATRPRRRRVAIPLMMLLGASNALIGQAMAHADTGPRLSNDCVDIPHVHRRRLLAAAAPQSAPHGRGRARPQLLPEIVVTAKKP